MAKKLAEFISPENQEAMRGQLFGAIYKSRLGLMKVAEDMGISYLTLNKFLNEEKDVAFDTLVKIDHFIMKYEE